MTTSGAVVSESELLTLKYRPRTFSDMVGQKAVRVVLKKLVTDGPLPGGLLLHGGWGAGKTTAARIVAAALNCEQENPELRPCGKCGTCEAVVEGHSSDVLEIDAASSGRVEDIRDLREQVRFAPVRRKRVVILDEVHALSPAAFQALLKTLEEPGPNVLFELATTNLDKVPETIASRCFGLEFRRITVPDIAARIRWIADQESYQLAPELAMAIASRSHGALRDGVMLLQECMTVGVRTPEQLVALKGDTDVEARIVTALVQGKLAEAFELTQRGLEALPSPSDLVARIVSCLRRVLVLASLGPSAAATSVSPPATPGEVALAAAASPARFTAALRVLWDYYRSVAPAADAFAAMDLVVVMLSEALSGALSTPPRSSTKTHVVQTSPSKTRAGSSAPETVDDILDSPEFAAPTQGG